VPNVEEEEEEEEVVYPLPPSDLFRMGRGGVRERDLGPPPLPI